MISVSAAQLDALAAAALAESLGRIDGWLGVNLTGWATWPPEARRAHLLALPPIFDAFALRQEADMALLAWLLLAQPDSAAFLARPDVMALQARDDANRGAVLHDLYAAAGLDIAPLAARLG